MHRSRRALLGGAAIVALAALATASRAAQPAERELLGVRIWRDYAAVLKQHGDPTRVVPGVALPPAGVVGGFTANMQSAMPGMGMRGAAGLQMPGAPPMMGGASMMPGGASMAGAMGAMGAIGGPMGGSEARGARGMPGMGGMMSGGPPMGARPTLGRGPGGMQMGGGMDEDDSDEVGKSRRGALGGMQAGRSAMASLMPGAAGMGMAPGGRPGAPMLMTGMGAGMGMAPGMGAAMAGTPGSATMESQMPLSRPDEQVKETWVYVRGAHTFQFLFNEDGRVIGIQSFGTKGAGATSRKVSLGDPLSKVYKQYGWAGTTSRNGDALTLDYSQKAHVTFELADRRDGKGIRVVGITIAPSEGKR